MDHRGRHRGIGGRGYGDAGGGSRRPNDHLAGRGRDGGPSSRGIPPSGYGNRGSSRGGGDAGSGSGRSQPSSSDYGHRGGSSSGEEAPGRYAVRGRSQAPPGEHMGSSYRITGRGLSVPRQLQQHIPPRGSGNINPVRYPQPTPEVVAAEKLQAAAPPPPAPDKEVEQAAGACGRGGVRGRRVITEVIRSRPSDRTMKSGTSGSKIIVQTNFFRAMKTPKWSIFQYHVDFSPEIDVTRIRRAYLAQHRELLGGYIYNGSILYTCTNLSDKMVNEVLELTTVNRAGETILLKIKYVGTVSPAETEMLHLLNVIFRQSMEKLDLQQVQRNFFDPKAKINLNNFNLEIWPGYETSIRQHEHDVLLCVDLASKVLRTESVYSIFCTMVKESKDFQTAFCREISGSIVVTDYNNMTYRVVDVDFNKNPRSTFQTRSEEISFAEYYKRRYNIHIRDLKQPMLVAQSTDKNLRSKDDEQILLLIPELCRPTGLTDSMRRNFRLMKAIADETRLRPDLRIKRLITFNRRLRQSEQCSAHLKNWQLKIDDNLVEAPARVLSSERIVFGNNKMYLCDKNADWTREFRNNKMFAQTDIHNWAIVVPSRMCRDAAAFVDLLMKAAWGMRMEIKNPKVYQMADDRTASYSRYLEDAASTDPQLIMAIIPSQNEEKYACIKKKLCVDRPIPSQVMCGKTISPGKDGGRGLMSVATKVVIQMNAKLLGTPWSIEMPLNGLMTVGFDIHHSAKDRMKSYGALVATMDMKLSSRYFSHVSEHLKGQELSNEISLSMSLALDAYLVTHSCLPQRILFYRDGVGDGQLGQVFRTEVKVLKAKIDSYYKKSGVKPQFAFIVVSKRINTRFFIQEANPPPGTVVDDVITLPERYDFYLVSQSVRQGTVAPTSYNVIYDSFGLPPDKMQILTYKMTHLYYNWSGTTRVPAVCQYAHKLALFVGQSLFRAPSSSLQANLFFL